MREQLLGGIKRNKYYVLLFDSTPDVEHVEQMSQVIRFVDVDHLKKKVSVKEAFLGYIHIHAKDAAAIKKIIVETLESDKLPLEDCRSQC